jgi:hypothetical protein
MRWQPHEPVCAECGFDWNLPREDSTDLVARAPGAVAEAMARHPDPERHDARPWSAAMYLWHMVDVLRIGTERLLTLSHDPGRGLACWDENALADVRRYERLSPAVGLIVLSSAAGEWQAAARATPAGAQVEHPEFGAMGAVEVIRRNAHEMHHHLMDISRWPA